MNEGQTDTSDPEEVALKLFTYFEDGAECCAHDFYTNREITLKDGFLLHGCLKGLLFFKSIYILCK